MSEINRLRGDAASPQARINPAKTIRFEFNNKLYTGCEGDTVASALLANGIQIVGRSFKYSRPRGVMSAGAEEPNAILQVGKTAATQTPNVRATQQQLYPGLVCRSTNGWPSAKFDLTSAVGKLFGRFLPPGFYYKTFMAPKALWMTYEKVIRMGAGLGQAPKTSDPDIYETINQHTDVLVIGGGAAGLTAALNAARSGARVIIADEQNEFGGNLLGSTDQLDGAPAQQWIKRTVSELAGLDHVLMLNNATVNGYHDHNFLTIHERCTDHLLDIAPQGVVRQRLHRVRAAWVVLATGAHERPLVYANNDLPGCMLASAVSTYINRYNVVPGKKLLLTTTSDEGYKTAFDWHRSGRTVIAIADTREQTGTAVVQQAAEYGIEILFASAVIEAIGKQQVRGAKVAQIDAQVHQIIGTARVFSCDTIATAGGWSPVVHLSCHTGARPQWRDDINGFVPGETHQKMIPSGSANGIYALQEVVADAAQAGITAASNAGFAVAEPVYPAAKALEGEAPMAIFHVPHQQPSSRAPKQFVDYQLDVTAAGIELAVREGFESIEHVKRYTALGFGTDQGKLSNINGMAIAARALGQSIPETGTTVFRPNYTPVAFGAIVGRNCDEFFDLERYTALHRWHQQNGAKFENIGQWKRPWYYPKAGESMQDALNRECLATRQQVGIIDASTLGKIDIQGADAREFLNRIYTNAWSKLGVGKCRYGLMCGEDGMVFDDGVTSCLADNHFLMTTTTGGAAGVLQWLEIWHQTEWPELEVYFNSVTDHWATMSISGPNARKLLAELTDIDLNPETFKFMEWREGLVADIPARVFRISFTGEQSYEINVQANYALEVWEKLFEYGEKYQLTPYGTETMHILRAEKGFIIVGQDTDGSVTPEDLGMSWAIARKKSFSFLGKRGMARADCVRSDRKQFVGLKTADPQQVAPEGSQIVFDPDEPIPMTMVGHVTSSYYSANLGRSIALAVVKGGLQRMGETVYLPQPNGSALQAEICSPVFYDPEGARQHV